MANWWDEYVIPGQTAQAAPPSVMPAPPQAPAGPSVFAPPPQAAAPAMPPSVFSGGIAGIPLEVRAMMGMAGPEKALGPLTSFLTRAPIEIMGPDGRPMFVGPDQAIGRGSPKTFVDLQKLQLDKMNADVGIDGSIQPNTLGNRRLGLDTQNQQFRQGMDIANFQQGQAVAPVIADARAPGGTRLNPGPGTAAALAAAEKEGVDRLYKSADVARAAASGIQSIYEGRKLLDQGAITGFGANFRTSFGSMLQTAGLAKGNDAVANTQAYMSAMAAQVFGIVKQLGAGSGISDADRAFAEKAAGANVEITEEALRKVLDIGERASRRAIELHGGLVEPYKNSGVYPPAILNQWNVTAPPAYTPPPRPAAPPSPAGTFPPLPPGFMIPGR